MSQPQITWYRSLIDTESGKHATCLLCGKILQDGGRNIVRCKPHFTHGMCDMLTAKNRTEGMRMAKELMSATDFDRMTDFMNKVSAVASDTETTDRDESVPPLTVMESASATWHKGMYLLGQAVLTSGVPFSFLDNPYVWHALAAFGVGDKTDLPSIPAFVERDARKYGRQQAIENTALERLNRETLSNIILPYAAGSVQEQVLHACKNANTLVMTVSSWVDNRNKHCGRINYAVRTPTPVFWDSESAAYHDQNDGEYCATRVGEQVGRIDEMCGSGKVVAVVMDNCSTMRKAWRLLKQKRPNLWTLGCAARITSLLVQDVVDAVDDLRTMLQHCNDIVKTVRWERFPNKRLSATLRTRHVKCKLSVTSRWTTEHSVITWVLDHFDDLRVAATNDRCLADYFSDATWSFMSNPANKDKLRDVSEFLGRFTVVIQAVTSDRATLSDVFMSWQLLRDTIESSTYLDQLGPTVKQQVCRLLVERWQKYLNHDVIMAAVSLDPRYMDFTGVAISGALERIARAFYTPEQYVEFEREVGDFWDRTGVFRDMPDVHLSHPRNFWRGFRGKQSPQVSKLANVIFSVPASCTASGHDVMDETCIFNDKARTRSSKRARDAVIVRGFEIHDRPNRGNQVSVSKEYDLLCKKLSRQYMADKQRTEALRRSLDALARLLMEPAAAEAKLQKAWEEQMEKSALVDTMSEESGDVAATLCDEDDDDDDTRSGMSTDADRPPLKRARIDFDSSLRRN